MILTGGNNSVIYDEQAGSNVVATSDQATVTATEREAKIIDKIDNAFNVSSGTAVSGSLAGVMQNSASTAIRTVMDTLKKDLAAVTDDSAKVNQDMRVGQEDVSGFYTSGNNNPNSGN